MDLTNYAGLQAAIADYLNRSNLTTQIPAFIQLAEAEMAADVRRKTIRTTFDVAAESNTLPSDCGVLRSAYPLTGSPSLDLPLEITTPEELAFIRANHEAVTGRPVALAVVDGNLLVSPAPDQTYTLQVTYYEKLTPLTDLDTQNSILLEAPNLYLYGALLAATPFLQHDERIPTWQQLYDKGVAKLNGKRQEEEFALPLKRVKLPRVFG